MGLCRLMQHTITNRDTRVAFITIPIPALRPSRKGIGDERPTPTSMPLLIKILKLFVHALTIEVRSVESDEALRNKFLHQYDDSSDSDTSLVPECQSEKGWSSHNTEIDDDEDDDDEVEDDPLDLQDPVYNLKVGEYTVNFLKEFLQANSEYFMELVQQLEHREKVILVTTGILANVPNL